MELTRCHPPEATRSNRGPRFFYVHLEQITHRWHNYHGRLSHIELFQNRLFPTKRFDAHVWKRHLYLRRDSHCGDQQYFQPICPGGFGRILFVGLRLGRRSCHFQLAKCGGAHRRFGLGALGGLGVRLRHREHIVDVHSLRGRFFAVIVLHALPDAEALRCVLVHDLHDFHDFHVK